nr:hypothetical protein [Tanacetum cinerariifolium]
MLRGERVELGCLGDTSFGRLAAHFGLVSDEGLMGLTIISRKPSLIDMDKLVKLNICARLSDTWAWVASGPESTHVGTLATPAASLTKTIAQRLSRLEEEVYSLRGDMGEQRGVLYSMAYDFSRFSTWTVTSLSHMIYQSEVRYTSYSDFQIPY